MSSFLWRYRRVRPCLEVLEDRITPSTAANAAELATLIQQGNTSNTADIGAFEVQPPPPPPSPPGGSGATTPAPPSLFQALLSLYIDGAAWEAFNLSWQFIYGDDFNIDNYYSTPSQLATVRANAAAAGIDYDAVASLNAFLENLRSFPTIQTDIAANAPYAGPFAAFAVIAGAEGVQQAVQL